MPYRDLFDMNFPGVYLLHLLVVRDAGHGRLGVARVRSRVAGASRRSASRRSRAPWGGVAAAAAALLFAALSPGGGRVAGGAARLPARVRSLLAGALGVARWTERAGAAPLAWGGLALGAGADDQAARRACSRPRSPCWSPWRRGGPAAASPRRSRSSLGGAAVVPALGGRRGCARRARCRPGATSSSTTSSRSTRAWAARRLERSIALAVVDPARRGGALALAWRRARRRRFGARHAVAALGVAYGARPLRRAGQGLGVPPLSARGLRGRARSCAGLGRGAGAAAGVLGACRVAGRGSSGVRAARRQGARGARTPAGCAPRRARVRRAGRAISGARLRRGDTVQVLDTDRRRRPRAAAPRRRASRRASSTTSTSSTTSSHPTIRALRAELVRDLDARPPALIVLFEDGLAGAAATSASTRFPGAARAGWPRLRSRRTAGPGYRIYAKRHDS